MPDDSPREGLFTLAADLDYLVTCTTKIRIHSYITFSRRGEVVARVPAEFDFAGVPVDYQALALQMIQRGGYNIILPVEEASEKTPVERQPNLWRRLLARLR